MPDKQLPQADVDPEKAQEIEDLFRKCISELNSAGNMIDQITVFQQKNSSSEKQGPEGTWESKARLEKIGKLNNIKELLNDAIEKIGVLLKQIVQLSKGLKFGQGPKLGMGMGGSSSTDDEDSEDNG